MGKKLNIQNFRAIILALFFAVSSTYAQKNFEQLYQCYDHFGGLAELGGDLDIYDTKENYHPILVQSKDQELSSHLMLESGYDNLILLNKKGAKLIISEESELAKDFFNTIERRIPIHISPIDEENNIDIYYIAAEDMDSFDYSTEGSLERTTSQSVEKLVKKITVPMIKKESILSLETSTSILSSIILKDAQRIHRNWNSNKTKEHLHHALTTEYIYHDNGSVSMWENLHIIPENLETEIRITKSRINNLKKCDRLLANKAIDQAVALEKDVLKKQLTYLTSLHKSEESLLSEIQELEDQIMLHRAFQQLLKNPDFQKILEEILERHSKMDKAKAKKKRIIKRI